jgi:chorismate dehydratase
MHTMRSAQQPKAAARGATPPIRVGCVSYLNAKPLIAGLDETGASVRYDVPGRLLAGLEAGEVDLALCPVIDYFRAAQPLRIVPAGGIGCFGPTLTVRLFSQVPLEQVTTVHGDRDSHTSIALLRILLAEQFGQTISIEPYNANQPPDANRAPQAVLLIGDKVVTAAPKAEAYPYTMDLGEAWHALTGLPFVFAVWLAPRDAPLGDWPARLDRQRRDNQQRLEQIVQQYAPAHGWSIDLARKYLTQILHYEIGQPQCEAIERFADLAAKYDLIAPPDGLELAPLNAPS